jgi:GNAT superfamily N-acetyltransferase
VGLIDHKLEVGVLARPHCFARLATDLPVVPLLKKLEQHPGLWQEITARQTTPGSPHHDTECIFLRWCPEQTVEAAFYQLETIDYPATKLLMPEAGDVFLALMEILGKEYRGPLADYGRVIITKLKAGGKIDTHMDEGKYADRYDRFHICLQSDLGNLFAVGGHGCWMQPGEAWWFNHKRPHWAENTSERERIHMIVDVAVPAFRSQRGFYVQRERAEDWGEEGLPLFERHREEISQYQDIPLNVDLNWYIEADRLGHLRCYTARLNGDLIGYAVFFLSHNRRYMTSYQAVQDVLFVVPEHRHGRVGLQLIRHAEDALRAEKVQIIYQHSKANREEGKLFEKLGYELVDFIHAKRLDRKEA